MTNRVMRRLRLTIVVIAASLVVTQSVFLPLAASASADQYPEFAALQYPALALSVAILAAAELALFGAWRLLGLAREGVSLTSPVADRWVRVEIAAGLMATGLVTWLNVLLSHAGANPPLGWLILSGATVCGAAMILAVVVMRHYLRGQPEGFHKLASDLDG